MKALRFALSSIAIAAAAAAAVPAVAQTIMTEYGQPSTAVGNKINIKKVPVLQSNGTTKYYDFTVAFKTNTNGVPLLDATNSTFVVVTAPIAPALQPGTYSDGNGAFYTVTSGGPDTSGRLTYSISSAGFSANVLSGPLLGHPDYTLINACNFGAGPAYGHATPAYAELYLATVTATSISITGYNCNFGAPQVADGVRVLVKT